MGAGQPPAARTIHVQITMKPAWHDLLDGPALDFIAALCDRFSGERDAMLAKRTERQKKLDKGALPDFLPETRAIREDGWKVAPIPADLQDRRVEITGPAERKMIINALNSGAKVFMADFEDSLTPTWQRTVEGQINLRDAVSRTITFSNPDGKQYRLNDKTATL